MVVNSSTRLLEALKAHPKNGEVDAELIDIAFSKGYEKYSRSGLIISGQYGKAEASPLAGYFEDFDFCISGAIASVTNPKPPQINSSIPVNILISNEIDLNKLDVNNDAAIKVKVSSLNDVDMVKKIRDIVGPDTPIRIDCNGGFDEETAISIISQLNTVNLEFVEQPCKTNEEIARVRKAVQVPIAIDETARNNQDLSEIKKLDAAEIIVIKIQPCGGISNAYELAQIWDSDVVVSSMMESNIGVELGFELARSLPVLKYACGLSPSPIDHVVSKPID